MPQSHPYQAYHRTNVQTADQRKLIVMLYDGLIRFLRKSALKIEENDMEGAHNYLVRSREIVQELLATLKPEKSGEIGQNSDRNQSWTFSSSLAPPPWWPSLSPSFCSTIGASFTAATGIDRLRSEGAGPHHRSEVIRRSPGSGQIFSP